MSRISRHCLSAEEWDPFQQDQGRLVLISDFEDPLPSVIEPGTLDVSYISLGHETAEDESYIASLAAGCKALRGFTWSSTSKRLVEDLHCRMLKSALPFPGEQPPGTQSPVWIRQSSAGNASAHLRLAQ